MLTDITLGQYYPGSSCVHRLDPRVKIIGVVIYVTTLFFAQSAWAYALVVAFAVVSTLLARIPIPLVARAVRPLWVIIALTLVMHFFTTPGQPLWSWTVFTVTREGVTEGLLMAMRLVLLIVASSLLTFTTSPIVLTDGIERLLSPLRRVGVPAHELAMMMTIALRFIPTLLEETDKIMKAQMARGADFSSGNLLRRARNMVPLLVPLFVSAFRRADELAAAMEARCYRGGEGRTHMREFTLVWRDIAALAVVAVVAGAVLVLRYCGV